MPGASVIALARRTIEGQKCLARPTAWISAASWLIPRDATWSRSWREQSATKPMMSSRGSSVVRSRNSTCAVAPASRISASIMNSLGAMRSPGIGSTDPLQPPASLRMLTLSNSRAAMTHATAWPASWTAAVIESLTSAAQEWAVASRFVVRVMAGLLATGASQPRWLPPAHVRHGVPLATPSRRRDVTCVTVVFSGPRRGRHRASRSVRTLVVVAPDLSWLPDRHLQVAATLAHADTLFGQLTDVLFAYQAQPAGTIGLEEVRAGTVTRTTVTSVASLPRSIPLLVADVLTTLRAAVEHTLYAEVEHANGRTLTAVEAGSVAMPAALSEKKFDGWLGDRKN